MQLKNSHPGVKLRSQQRPLATPVNQVIAAMRPGERQRLLPKLELVPLALGQILYEPGRPIRHVYFPLDSLISLLTAVDGRLSLEVGMVGKEGMLGLPLIMGTGSSAVRALVQGAGSALRMKAAPFLAHVERSASLKRALLSYTHSLMRQISQTAACNRFHNAQSRLCRWLLMTRERLGKDRFLLTHAFLAHMLGMRREGVTEAATGLKRRRLISYSRGCVQILNVSGLKASSCSCYRVLHPEHPRPR